MFLFFFFSKQQQQNQAIKQAPAVQQQAPEVKVETDTKPSTTEIADGNATTNQTTQKDENKSKFGFPQPSTYNVADYRSLVKTLVCGVKTITWGVATCKTNVSQTGAAKQFQPRETLVFIRLVKWALKALDIYTLNIGPQPVHNARLNQQNVRSKEEKEVLEHFSSVVSNYYYLSFFSFFFRVLFC